MIGSRQLYVSSLVFGIIVTLAACSSVTPTPAATPTPSENLDLASCIEVGVEAPAVVTEGKGLKATLSVKNVCEQAIQLPLTKATGFSEGEATNVEVSFNLSITDFEEDVHPDDPTITGGYLGRWSSMDTNDDGRYYDDAMKTVTLSPSEKLERELSWNGHLRDGPSLAAGKYRLWASFDLVPAGVTNWRTLLPDRIYDIDTIFAVQPLDIVAK